MVDDQTTDGRGEDGKGDVVSGVSIDHVERAVDGTSYLAAVMIGAILGQGEGCSPRWRKRDTKGSGDASKQSSRSRKSKRGKEELRGDQATNSGKHT